MDERPAIESWANASSQLTLCDAGEKQAQPTITPFALKALDEAAQLAIEITYPVATRHFYPFGVQAVELVADLVEGGRNLTAGG